MRSWNGNIVILLSMFLVISSCGKSEKEALFTITYTAEVNIQPGWNTVERHFIEIQNIPGRLQQKLDNHNITIEDISRIETASSELYNIFGNKNLDILEVVTVDIFPPGQADSELEAAYLNPVPEDVQTRIQLIPSLANFKEFFKNQTISIRVGMGLRQIPSEIQECRLELRMAFIE